MTCLAVQIVVTSLDYLAQHSEQVFIKTSVLLSPTPNHPVMVEEKKGERTEGKICSLLLESQGVLSLFST